MAALSKFKDQLSSSISGKISPQGVVAVVGTAAIIWKLFKVRAESAKRKR